MIRKHLLSVPFFVGYVQYGCVYSVSTTHDNIFDTIGEISWRWNFLYLHYDYLS